MSRFTVPDDFNPSEAARRCFDGNPENDSAAWVKKCSDAILNDFDGIPVGTAIDILRAAEDSLLAASTKIAKETVFRPGSPEFPGWRN